MVETCHLQGAKHTVIGWLQDAEHSQGSADWHLQYSIKQCSTTSLAAWLLYSTCLMLRSQIDVGDAWIFYQWHPYHSAWKLVYRHWQAQEIDCIFNVSPSPASDNGKPKCASLPCTSRWSQHRLSVWISKNCPTSPWTHGHQGSKGAEIIVPPSRCYVHRTFVSALNVKLLAAKTHHPVSSSPRLHLGHGNRHGKETYLSPKERAPKEPGEDSLCCFPKSFTWS